MTVKIPKKLWRVFAATLDERSRQDYYNWMANGMISHLMASNKNPELLAWYIGQQNKRLARKKEA